LIGSGAACELSHAVRLSLQVTAELDSDASPPWLLTGVAGPADSGGVGGGAVAADPVAFALVERADSLGWGGRWVARGPDHGIVVRPGGRMEQPWYPQARDDGVQGSGTGTQSKLLAADFDLVHIGVGDIFRWNVQEHTKLGAQVRRILAEGGLVDDELVESVPVVSATR
jgi:hypothetical protein